MKFNIKRNFFNIVYIIIKSNKEWLPPKKSEILIYDFNSLKALSPHLKNNSNYILHIRGEVINIPCFFFTLFKACLGFSNLREIYTNKIIKSVQPRLIITYMDNSVPFYKLSVDNNKILKVFIQNGWRGAHEEIFTLYKNISKKFFINYMLVYNKNIASKYKEFIDGKAIVIGSINNNHIDSLTQKNILKDSILYISSYRKNEGNPLQTSKTGKPLYWEDLFQYDIKLLKWLSEWCSDKSKTLLISLRYKDEKYGEKNFYNNIFKKSEFTWKFLHKNDYYDSYRFIQKAEIVVSTPSTLGYEAFSRGKKTAFFICRGQLIGSEGLDFGWPKLFPDKGPFWSNKPDKSDFLNIMNFLNAISDKNWNKLYQKYQNDIMKFDPGNSVIKELLDKLLSKPKIP